MAFFASAAPFVPSVRFAVSALLLATCVCVPWCPIQPASALLLPEFDYHVDQFPADEIERDLLFDGRAWNFHGHDVLGPDSGDDDYFRSDFSLASLKPISATPPFTLDPSYISPDEVIPARAKRANRRGQKSAKAQRKREQLVDHSYEEDRDELEDDDEGGADGKKASGEGSETEEVGGEVEEYAARYEKFIAKHFDDVERRREMSAPQRKAPRQGGHASAESGEGAREGEDDRDEETDGDYRFDRVDYSSSDDYDRIKAESEEQSRRLAKDPRNCRTYEKDGMVCSVCHDPASDSASESCAYATEPHHRKYAYVKERNYDSKKPGSPGTEKAEKAADKELMIEDDDEDDEHELSAESRPERQASGTDGDDRPPTTTPVSRGRKAHPLRKPVLRSKPHQLATNGGGYRYQPPAVDLRSNRASMKLRSVALEHPATDDPNIYVMDYSDQDDVARVLAEFKTRDWSNCRKGKRAGDDGGLTCYQCLDAAGVNHEECMYVSESRQVATGIALPPPPPPPVGSSSQLVAAGPSEGKLRKRKKVVPVRKGTVRAADPLEPQAPADDGPVKEKQTVKRTVSFRSFVTGSGRGQPSAASSLGPDASERVIHYEHHISHEVP